jgi:hypothetical protein
MSEEFDYDYRLEDPSVERIDEIAKKRILIAKSSMTINAAEAIFEREKIDVFKGIFKRPKENEVAIKSIKRSFEPYLVIGGSYEIRYLTERTYDIDLIDEAESVFILGEEIEVKKEEEEETEVEIETEKKKKLFDGLFDKRKKRKQISKPEIQLTGIEHIHIEKEITEARNYRGKSINPESLPEAEFQQDDNFLEKEGIVVPKEYIDIKAFQKEIMEEYTQRPEIAQRVLFEKFIITDKKIIFYPVFWAEMVYKGNKRKNVRLDAISKKLITKTGVRYAPPPDLEFIVDEATPRKVVGVCPECGDDLEDDDTFCSHCGVKLA